MQIKSLELENWKCFSDTLTLNFSNIEIFSFPNGAGKTSVLEAMYYGLWGKTDSRLASYQNHEGQTVVKVDFEIDGVDYKIHREFPKGKAILYRNGKEYKKGAKEIFEYMDSLVSYSLVKRLWFKGDIAECEVLDFNFFKNEILADKLKIPAALQKYYASEQRAKSKEAKAIWIDDSLRPLDEINSDIADIKINLKDRNGINDTAYIRALHMKDAVKEYRDASDAFNALGVSPVPQDNIRRWRSIDVAFLKQRIADEEAKFVDPTLASLNSNTLRSVVNANRHEHKCVVCDGEWTHEREEYVDGVLNRGFKSLDVIKNLQEDIIFKNSIPEDLILKSEELYMLESRVDSCIDYQSIIDSYNKENNLMWEKLDRLNSERDNVIRNKANIDRVAQLQKEADECKRKAAFVKTYLDKATAFYTQSLLDKSNEILTYLNDDYSNISISSEDNSLQVDVRGDTLLVKQLSRGERTMVAMSLIYSIRDIFTPSMPLIFDESFASLSEKNNYGVIDFVKGSLEQLFIITHNKSWIDYAGYDKFTTNIRTHW